MCDYIKTRIGFSPDGQNIRVRTNACKKKGNRRHDGFRLCPKHLGSVKKYIKRTSG